MSILSQQFSTYPRCLFYLSAILNRLNIYLSAILNRPEMTIPFLSDPQQTRDNYPVFVLFFYDMHSTCLAIFAGSESVMVKKKKR